MKPTKAIITMFFMLLITLALVKRYGDLMNYGLAYFDDQFPQPFAELIKEHADETVNLDGTIMLRKKEELTPEVRDEIEKRVLNEKYKFAFIIVMFIFFLVLIYLLAALSVALVKRFDQKDRYTNTK